MPFTLTSTRLQAQTTITGAFDLLGVYAPGETVDGDDMTDAFRRLNNMMSAWVQQPLTIPAIAREVFALTANVGTYSIGPGGDFDTSRPTKLTGAGLLLNMNTTPQTLTSLTSVATTATGTLAGHGLSRGDTVTIHGATPAAYNGTFTVLTVPSLSTFTYVFAGASDAAATGTITMLNTTQTGSNTLVEIPRALLTDDAWEAIQVKTLTSPLFTGVYYNDSFYGGLGTISLWPVPTTAANGLVLYRQQQLGQFASLTAEYDVPDGYAEAIEYNLALRLAAPYKAVVPPDVRQIAASSLAIVKRMNTPLSDLPTDLAWTNDRRYGYNIQTGTGS